MASMGADSSNDTQGINDFLNFISRRINSPGQAQCYSHYHQYEGNLHSDQKKKLCYISLSLVKLKYLDDPICSSKYIQFYIWIQQKGYGSQACTAAWSLTISWIIMIYNSLATNPRVVLQGELKNNPQNDQMLHFSQYQQTLGQRLNPDKSCNHAL